MNQLGKTLILFGVVLVFTGGFILLFQRFSGEKPFPGTLRIELGNTTIFIPILFSIIASVALTLLLNLLSRFLSR